MEKTSKQTSYKITRMLVPLWSLTAGSFKKSIRFNLKNLFGYADSEIISHEKKILENFCLTLHDFFQPQKVHFHIRDKEKLEAIRQKHGGVLFLTFHLGHWELGARIMQSWGWPVTAVYQPYQNRFFKRLIESKRAPGVNFLAVGAKAAKGVRDALKRKEIVAMLGDHPFGEEGTPVKILNRKVLWPKGPILLAVKEKAPIIVAVIIRIKDHEYEAIIEEPLIPTNSTRAEIDKLVQEVASKFEHLLIQNIDQWYRFRAFTFVD
ncbi:MAG: lysophospholipid acyltransferase family protein [Elusimicrobiota bacterium]